MARHAIEFLRYCIGLRRAYTSLTTAESALLRSLAAGRLQVVEVGVFEGVTSAMLAEAIGPHGSLYLVDPYQLGTRPERMLGLSFTSIVAHRSVRRFRSRIRFVRAKSLAAATSPLLPPRADLIFIDADHAYEAVRDDFLAWAPRLAPGGIMAFHDSRCSPARPDLTPETGPVRFLAEIRGGLHGPWGIVGEADSLTAISAVERFPQ